MLKIYRFGYDIPSIKTLLLWFNHNVLMQKNLGNSLLPNGYYCTISSNFYQIFEPLKINYNIDLSVISRLYF